MPVEPSELGLATIRSLDERVVRLDVGIDEVLQRLREHGGVVVADEHLSTRPPTGDLFIELRERGFTIHAPHVASDSLTSLAEIGPALHGELTEGEDGTRLALRLRRLAPTRSQATKLAAGLAVAVLGIVSMLSVGAYQHALGISLFMALALTVPLAIARRRSRRRILELYAVVERAVGPVTHVAVDAPYRKRALPPGR